MNDLLIDLIKKAFSESTFPGNEKLIKSSYDDDAFLVKAHFTDKNDWTLLSSTFIDFDSALSFFSDEAFCFYIPAFMIADIKDGLNFNEPYYNLCWSITDGKDIKIAKQWGGGTIGESAKTCFSLFTNSQIGVIIAYLKWKEIQIQNSSIISQALANYWEKQTK